ncbi:MAG TPA: 2'-5' RNA ligase family protein [Chloroflexi bacterium]|nr:2'-5' RNA ligase family protein [Chloroflexota bacterium]
MDRWPTWGKRFQPGLFIIQPPEDVSAVVNAQRKACDPLSQSYIGAHITVTQPLIRTPSESEWDSIEQVLGNMRLFAIHYGPLKSFLPYPCIWYDVQPAEGVLAIREALHQTGFFNLEEGYIADFIPHMTITEGQSGPEVTRELLEKLQKESQSGSFLCEELVLSVPDQNFYFSVQNRIALGNVISQAPGSSIAHPESRS